MTRHLVSQLRKAELLALRDEIVTRLEVADASLKEFANRHSLDYDKLPPDFITAVTQACLSGMGFAPEEVRGIQRVQPRGRSVRADSE